jgi:transposase InsO family protein
VIGLYKAELIGPQGPWGSLEEVKSATLRWVWWFNHHRLFGPIGDVPPAEYEEAFFRPQVAPEELLRLN